MKQEKDSEEELVQFPVPPRADQIFLPTNQKETDKADELPVTKFNLVCTLKTKKSQLHLVAAIFFAGLVVNWKPIKQKQLQKALNIITSLSCKSHCDIFF